MRSTWSTGRATPRGSDSPSHDALLEDLDARVGALELPNTDSPPGPRAGKAQLCVEMDLRSCSRGVATQPAGVCGSVQHKFNALGGYTRLLDAVGSVDHLRAETVVGSDPVAIAGLAVGSVALFATAASGFFPPSTRAFRREEKAHPAEKC